MSRLGSLTDVACDKIFLLGHEVSLDICSGDAQVFHAEDVLR